MKPMEFVYLTSSPFSGSTLFAFLANTHPHIATVGEMTGLIGRVDPAQYDCSCGLRMKACHFWSRVSEQMAIRHQDFDPARFDTKFRIDHPLGRFFHASLPSQELEVLRDWLVRIAPRVDRRIEYLLARNKALAQSITVAANKPLFFDASKNPDIIRYLRDDPAVSLKVVHLVCDVRGVSYSRLKNKGETDWKRIVPKWIRMNRSIDRQLARLPPDRWLRIRYEELCKDPVQTMNRFFSFCGTRPFAIPANPQSVEHHIIGNRMRLGTISEIRVDDAWRRALPAEKSEYAASTAAPYLARYGYES
jgi:hypothetical protein